MQLKTLLVSSSVALGAIAAPAPAPSSQTFGLIAIRSGSAVQNSGVQAALSSLFVNLPSQNASCDATTNFATFYIQDTELHLYAASATPQTIFVDRSGMGQGKIGYVTGAEPLGKNWETKGWTVSDQELQFDGTGLQACPNSVDGGWSLWLAGVEKPGFNEGCLGIGARAVETDAPIGCLYTE